MSVSVSSLAFFFSAPAGRPRCGLSRSHRGGLPPCLAALSRSVSRAVQKFGGGLFDAPSFETKTFSDPERDTEPTSGASVCRAPAVGLPGGNRFSLAGPGNHSKLEKPVNDRLRWPRCRRRGATLVLAALLMVLLLGMVAFAVDIGRIVLVRTQLQVAADSAALASASDLAESCTDGVAIAQQYAGAHVAGSAEVQLDAADVVFGTWDFQNRTFSVSEPIFNAVQVTTRRDGASGGEVPLLFGRLLGTDRSAVSAEAIAALSDNFVGFQAPSSGGNLPILPFALDKTTWDDLLAGNGDDERGWDSESEQVTSQPDGMPEVNLYPQDTGAAGNFGTLNIGRRNNGVPGLRRQILDGLSPEDLEPYDGKLELDAHGELQLTGDPGISAGMKDALAAIKGQKRVVPVYSRVTGHGSKSRYTIVQFAGVRIVEVRLTGSDKRVMIQPAKLTIQGGIPASGTDRKSYNVYSRVHLVR